MCGFFFFYKRERGIDVNFLRRKSRGPVQNFAISQSPSRTNTHESVRVCVCVAVDRVVDGIIKFFHDRVVPP